MVKRTTGDLRIQRLSVDEAGVTTVTPVGDLLPSNKEEIEAIFGEQFIRLFNDRALMPGVKILEHAQQTTADLDYKITCWRADYLELAEITALSEVFGHDIRGGAPIQTLTFATWIYENAIKAKFEKYGRDLAGRTFLLLYPTFPEFFPHDALVDCLRSLCWYRGSTFAGVFLLWSSGPEEDGLHLPYVISPWQRLVAPEAFAQHSYQNQHIVAAPDGAGAIAVPMGQSSKAVV